MSCLLGVLVTFGLATGACGRTETGGSTDDQGGEGGEGGEPATESGGRDSGGTSPSGGSSAGGVFEVGGMSAGGGTVEGTGGSYVGPSGRCVPGSYATTELLEPLVCAPWTECEPGEKVTRIGTEAENRLCAPCEQGTFSTAKNTFSCTPIKACSFDEKLAQAGTSTSDATCKPTGLFTPAALGSTSELIGMTVTDEGIYVLAGDMFGYVETRILRYSLTGQALDSISFETDAGSAQSITSIGSDVYVAGKVRKETPYDSPKTYVRRLDKTGKLLSEKLLDDQANTMRLATDGTSLFLASDGRVPGELRCYEPEGQEYCFQPYYGALILRRFDRDGALQAERTFTDESGAYVTLDALAVTGTGQAFVIGYGYALFPSATEFVAEFDLNFEPVHVHPTNTLGCSACSALAGDEGDVVSVFGRHRDLSAADFSVTRLKSGGTIDSILPVDVDGSHLKAIATTPDVLYLGGETFLSEATLFQRLKPDGTLIDQTIHSARIRQTVTAIALGPSGQAFAAGTGSGAGSGSERQLFVTPWPSEK